jgi:hypothetical protein
MGIRTTLHRTPSTVFECCIGPRKELEQRKAKEERNEMKEEEFTIYD